MHRTLTLTCINNIALDQPVLCIITAPIIDSLVPESARVYNTIIINNTYTKSKVIKHTLNREAREGIPYTETKCLGLNFAWINYFAQKFC